MVAGRILTAIAGVTTIVLLVSFWVASYHVVYSREGTAVIRKRFMTFEQTRVDIRMWTAQDFEAHPHLSAALKAQGYGDLIIYPPPPESRTAAAQRKLRTYSAKAKSRIREAVQGSRNWFGKRGRNSDNNTS